MKLTDKYRPQRLADLRGQAGVVRGLAGFVRRPASSAFIFDGTPGTGKTSAALALARELGVDVDKREWGGLHEVASGELTAETVRELFGTTLRYTSWHGSGWKVVVCNEADNMSDKAAFLFLDVLEHLPAKVVVIFTTNAIDKLPRRLRERCECHTFASRVSPEAEAEAQALIDHVWTMELGHNHSPRLADLTGWKEGGAVSFRGVVRALEPLIRAELPGYGTVPAPAPAPLAKAARIRLVLPEKREKSTMELMLEAEARREAFLARIGVAA